MRQTLIRSPRPTPNRVRRCLLMAAVVTLIIALSRCPKIAQEEYESQLSVFSVLRTDRSGSGGIIVDRTFRVDEPDQPYIDSALVVLSWLNMVDTCIFDPWWRDYRSHQHLRVMPRTTYNLTIICDGFDTLYGKTTVPGDFEILCPGVNDTVTPLDTLKFITGNGAVLYNTSVEFESGYSRWLWFRCSASDSMVVIPLADLLAEVPTEDRVVLMISAFDPNFYKYHYERSDSVMKAGVIGGVGLFGSVHVKSVGVYFKPATGGQADFFNF